jgi:hypothetical protein
VTPETFEISVLPGYWSIIAMIAIFCLLSLVPLIGYLKEKRRAKKS